MVQLMFAGANGSWQMSLRVTTTSVPLPRVLVYPGADPGRGGPKGPGPPLFHNRSIHAHSHAYMLWVRMRACCTEEAANNYSSHRNTHSLQDHCSMTATQP